jgi:hypothetical protein
MAFSRVYWWTLKGKKICRGLYSVSFFFLTTVKGGEEDREAGGANEKSLKPSNENKY